MIKWLCLHNASLEGPELFGPPEILAQLRLWAYKFHYLLFFLAYQLQDLWYQSTDSQYCCSKCLYIPP